MKTLINKQTEISTPDGVLDYCQLIRACLDNPPPGGFSPKDLRERQRIDNTLSNMNGDDIQLEDADAESLKRIVEQMRWAKRHADILMFYDDVKAL